MFVSLFDPLPYEPFTAVNADDRGSLWIPEGGPGIFPDTGGEASAAMASVTLMQDVLSV